MNGVALSRIEPYLGPDLATVSRLYPDGVVRLWGSTPTSSVGNAKAQALRDRRPGDYLFFYADLAFFSRARILHTFRNPDVAREVWGADEDGLTWEHVIALGDITNFEPRLPSAHVLGPLGLPATLRGIRIVSSDDFARIVMPVVAATGNSFTPEKPPTTGDRILAVAAGLETDAERVATLWMVGRAAATLPRLVDVTAARTELTALFGYLRIEGDPLTALHSLSTIGIIEFVDRRTRVGLTADVGQALTDGEREVRLLRRLLDGLAGLDRDEVLVAVSLAGYDSASGASEPVAGRRVSVDRLVRDAAVIAQVKQLYRGMCQICGVGLQVRRGEFSEHAHIRGLGAPHHGPDEMQNMLSLCPNHHVQFDTYSIYVDRDDRVRWAADDHEIGTLHRHGDHMISEAHLSYHRNICRDA